METNFRPLVVNLKGKRDNLPPNLVYIGRAQYQGGWKLAKSIWHNPYSVKEYGDDAVPLFKIYIAKLIRDDPDTWIPNLLELSGKTLGCWCGPRKPDGTPTCHGHVISDLVGELVEACLRDDEFGTDKFISNIFEMCKRH